MNKKDSSGESRFRSFSLYNHRNLSPNISNGNVEFARYNTLGYFDEFRTKDISVTEKTGNMPELWQGIKKMNSELVDDKDEGFSAKSYQNIFGYPIPSDNLGDSIKSQIGKYVTDEEFWNDHENPYIFIILIQFFDKSDDPKTSKDSIENKIKIYIKKYIEHIKKNFDQYKEVFLIDKAASMDVAFESKQETIKDIANDILVTKSKEEIENTESDCGEISMQEEYNPAEEEKKFIFTGYITYDKYDYIICVKTKCYLPFVLATQQLYSLFSDYTKECFSVSSFTVTAIDDSCIRNIADEVAPSICIKCTYNESNIYYYNKRQLERIKEDEGKYKFNVLNYMDSFQKRLKDFLYTDAEQKKLEDRDNYFRMYFISGENDIRFIARYVHMEKLLALFSKIESPLNDNYLGGFSTSINVTNEDVHLFIPEEVSHPNHSLVSKIIKCKCIIDTLDKKGFPEELIKTMHQINSGLSAIMPLNSNYRSYGFLSLFPDYYSYLKRLNSELEKPNHIITKKELDSAQDLMQYFGAALLTTIRSDFKEFQVPTFNANLYYTPTKLLVFYRAFIVNFLNYYNTLYCKSIEDDGIDSAQMSKQHFIVVPGNQFGATVFETAGGVYDDGKVSERFFVCEISEKNVYYIKTSLIILAHEVSHYGLKKIRNRRNRYEHIWMSYITTFVVLFLDSLYQRVGKDVSFSRLMSSSFSKMLLFDTCIFTPQMKKRLIEKIRIKYEIVDSEFRKNNHGIKNKYHYDKIQLMLEKNFRMLYKEIKDFVTSEICTTIQKYLFSVSTLDVNFKIQLNESILNIVEDVFETTFKVCFTRYNNRMIAAPHSFISYHYKEVFSDILAAITLNLEPGDYYNTIIQERRHQIPQTKSRSVMYRVSLTIDGIYAAITRIRDKINIVTAPFDFVRKTFNNFDMWLRIVNNAKEEKRFPEEMTDLNELVDQYKSVKDKLFDVFAVPISDKKYSVWYREIEEDQKNAPRVLFYDKNIYDYFVDYLSRCVISFFSEMYKKSLSDAKTPDKRIHSPSEFFSKINDEQIDYYKKMKSIDLFLSDFENDQLEALDNSDI